jgi:hypothetical protein
MHNLGLAWTTTPILERTNSQDVHDTAIVGFPLATILKITVLLILICCECDLITIKDLQEPTSCESALCPHCALCFDPGTPAITCDSCGGCGSCCECQRILEFQCECFSISNRVRLMVLGRGLAGKSTLLN